MEIAGWNERYRFASLAQEDLESSATPLLVSTAELLLPGEALDLACGAGRNALWLAANGWRVTAVDGARSAIDILKTRAIKAGLAVTASTADLEKREYAIEPGRWDFICICYYLQRDLIVPAQTGLKLGGVLLVIVHTTEGQEEPNQNRMAPGELRSYFDGWEIVHYYEGAPNDPAHKRSVAEIVAQKRAS